MLISGFNLVYHMQKRLFGNLCVMKHSFRQDCHIQLPLTLLSWAIIFRKCGLVPLKFAKFLCFFVSIIRERLHFHHFMHLMLMKVRGFNPRSSSRNGSQMTMGCFHQSWISRCHLAPVNDCVLVKRLPEIHFFWFYQL